MTIDFGILRPQIERCINRLHIEYCRAPASILTEDDLKFGLRYHLSRIPSLRRPIMTIHRGVRGAKVHAELSWYDETGRLRIRPDLTILEPEYTRCHPSYSRPAIDMFSGGGNAKLRTSLPSKQFEFAGNAITFELKFARNGINGAMVRSIKKDFAKIERILRILDEGGEGQSIFSYLVIFNGVAQPPRRTPLAKFLREHGRSSRHRIVYKAYQPFRRPQICSGQRSARLGPFETKRFYPAIKS
jgi:hypothetical protein